MVAPRHRLNVKGSFEHCPCGTEKRRSKWAWGLVKQETCIHRGECATSFTIYIYIHIDIYIYIHIYIQVFLQVSMYININIYIYLYLHINIYASMWWHIYICIYIYASMYWYIYIYVTVYKYYIYIYMYKSECHMCILGTLPTRMGIFHFTRGYTIQLFGTFDFTPVSHLAGARSNAPDSMAGGQARLQSLGDFLKISIWWFCFYTWRS
jgi:energy-coupling factor transporter transmembrane protein EcfT